MRSIFGVTFKVKKFEHKIKYLAINVTKNVKDLHIENYRWEYSSMAQHMPGKRQVISSNPCTKRKTVGGKGKLHTLKREIEEDIR